MTTAKAIPATVRTSELPRREAELLKRVDTVLAAFSRHHVQISEVHVPLAHYPNLAHTFRHIPIVDSREFAMRVVYSAGPASAPAQP